MVISIINNKGGVGKTTCTVNLAHALANKGKRVLVVDQDPQSNTSSILSNVGGKTLYHLYSGEATIDQCIYPTPYENVEILPNESATAALEIDLYTDVRANYYLLHGHLREYAEKNYDICLIDNSPSLGIFTIMSLLCSDSAIIPIESGSRYSIDGFVAAYEAIKTASSRVDHELKFLRALINKVDMRTTISKSSVDYMRRKFGEKLFNTTIPVNSDIMRSEADRQTVIRYSPNSTGARRFKALAEELIELLDSDRTTV